MTLFYCVVIPSLAGALYLSIGRYFYYLYTNYGNFIKYCKQSFDSSALNNNNKKNEAYMLLITFIPVFCEQKPPVCFE